MPKDINYPGVYIEELPRGEHSIAPVATSIAAFVGRAPKGPVAGPGPNDGPVTIFNYGDYQRFYGGLQHDYPLSYAVQDFFNNGGSEAIIARLFEPKADEGSGVAQLPFPASSLVMEAASPGDWGNLLEARVDNNGITDKLVESSAIAPYQLEVADLFNLTLTLTNADGKTVTTERYLNLTVRQTDSPMKDYPNRVDRVLENQSLLARVSVLAQEPPPNGASVKGLGGNEGTALSPSTYLGDQDTKTGIYLLEHVQIFNLLCIPPDLRITPDLPDSDQDLDPTVRQAAADYCTNRRAMYIVDPLARWTTLAHNGEISDIDPTDLGITGVSKDGIEVERNAAVYFPRVYKEDILSNGEQAVFAACGMIAGAIAANDMARGVWKAPAGQSVGLAGVTKLEVNLTNDQNGVLNPLGINCLRTFPGIGPVVWGARTLRGADQLEDDYKYIPVRRLTLYVEDALFQGTQWAAFEPNDEALWSALRLTATTFLAGMAKQGAFYDYKVTCDATTTTQTDIDLGVVNLIVQIAPVKPAEFVVIQIQQLAGAQPG